MLSQQLWVLVSSVLSTTCGAAIFPLSHPALICRGWPGLPLRPGVQSKRAPASSDSQLPCRSFLGSFPGVRSLHLRADLYNFCSLGRGGLLPHLLGKLPSAVSPPHQRLLMLPWSHLRPLLSALCANGCVNCCVCWLPPLSVFLNSSQKSSFHQ